MVPDNEPSMLPTSWGPQSLEILFWSKEASNGDRTASGDHLLQETASVDKNERKQDAVTHEDTSESSIKYSYKIYSSNNVNQIKNVHIHYIVF